MFTVQQTTHDYLNIVLTHNCTRQCPFCVDPSRGSGETISIEHVRAALAFARAQGVQDILLTGGEPTLHPEVEAIVAMVNAAGFRAIMTTNYSRPEVVRALDGMVACFNISYYGQPHLPRQADFRSDLTLHTLIHARQLSTHAELDAFIEQHQAHGHLKFSTLVPCTPWAAEHQQVGYLNELDCEWVVLFNEILGQVYRGAIIKRYDRIINPRAHQSFKAHVDGQITQSWDRASLPISSHHEIHSQDISPERFASPPVEGAGCLH